MAATAIIVLVAEDEYLIRENVDHALSDAGFQVVQAQNGQAAMRLIEESGATFRALVTDVNLSNGRAPTGWDVAHRAREVNPGIAVVYLTAAEADQWPAHGVPNSLLITKPFADAQIVTAVSQLINAANSQLPPAPA